MKNIIFNNQIVNPVLILGRVDFDYLKLFLNPYTLKVCENILDDEISRGYFKDSSNKIRDLFIINEYLIHALNDVVIN